MYIIVKINWEVPFLPLHTSDNGNQFYNAFSSLNNFQEILKYGIGNLLNILLASCFVVIKSISHKTYVSFTKSMLSLCDSLIMSYLSCGIGMYLQKETGYSIQLYLCEHKRHYSNFVVFLNALNLNILNEHLRLLV